jgi:hypothetical protein
MRRMILACVLLSAPLLAQNRQSLSTGEFLKSGEWLVSPMQKYIAYLQPDGNFCIDRGSSPAHITGSVWCSMVTGANAPFVALMQSDGNFVVYSSSTSSTALGPYLWGSMALAPGGAFVATMQDDGNFVIRATGTAVKTSVTWLTGTGKGTLNAVRSTLASIVLNNQMSCPPDCTMTVPFNTTVGLEVRPMTDARFVKWTGGCAGQTRTICVLTVTENPIATVGVEVEPPITLTAKPSPGGTIATPDQSLYCSEANQKCVATIPSTLKGFATVQAIPMAGYHFVQWLLDCARQPQPCTLTMDRAHIVGAEFAQSTGQ